MKPKILITDDEKPTRDVMARVLAHSYECLTAPDAEQALQIVQATPDLALLLTDYKMPGENGLSLIHRAKAINPSLACILITAFGEIDLAVEAMKDGADDFLTKPITDLSQMELRLSKALEKHQLVQKVAELQQQIDETKGLANFTGTSSAMQKIYTLIRQAARAQANVLVEGASGTGKELVARALHDLSPRAKGPFIAVECAALSPTLLESELFGHEKGAFTDAYRQKIGRFEAADGGTLFLDEITEIDLATQVKLLRVLETRRFQRVGGTTEIPSDFRLVAATNRDLAAYVRDGKFREDLYYRLNVIDIHLPSLRERPGDIALLASRFIKEFAKANGGSVTGIDAQAMHALEQYEWPGNVRQLRNVIEKMVVLSAGGKLTCADLPLEITNRENFDRENSAAKILAKIDDRENSRENQNRENFDRAKISSLADAKKNQILATLEACHYNKTKAAEQLGISRRTLHRKLNEWGLS